MTRDTTTVVYIAGTGRSGSTVLANALGQLDGWFSAGEVRYLFERGVGDDRSCGCGEPFHACPVWQAILESAFGDDVPDPAQVHAIQEATTRLRYVPELLASERMRRRVAARAATGAIDYLADLSRLYAAIAGQIETHHENRVVVDSSKLPSYAWLLEAAPGIDLRVVHLVRDPRAAAFSWGSKKLLTDRAQATHMEQIGPAKSAVLWDTWNLTTARLWHDAPARYLRVRYEDFVARPRDVLSKIAALGGDADADLPLVDDTTVELGVTHTVAGNPDRLRIGEVALRPDDRWKAGLPKADRRLVEALTWPIRATMGYGGRRGTDGEGELPHEAGKARRARARIARHVHWARTQGIDRMIEEDQLDPVERARMALSKARYRATRGVKLGTATPIWLVGVQRSGTNMVVRGLETSPEFEVHNENDRKAFERFELRDDSVLRSIVESSHHEYVLFKPLCDSHRVDALLDGMGTTSAGKAIWAYRDVDGRARSAVAKFGDVNRRVLARIAAGEGDRLWQAQRLSRPNRQIIESFDYNEMSDLSAAALFWYIRNSLFFELGLDARDDVHLVSYGRLVAEPEPVMRRLCDFIGFPYSPRLVDHVEVRSGSRSQIDLDPKIRELCAQLEARLDSTLSPL